MKENNLLSEFSESMKQSVNFFKVKFQRPAGYYIITSYLLPMGGARVLLLSGTSFSLASTASPAKFALELLRERSTSDGGAIDV